MIQTTRIGIDIIIKRFFTDDKAGTKDKHRAESGAMLTQNVFGTTLVMWRYGGEKSMTYQMAGGHLVAPHPVLSYSVVDSWTKSEQVDNRGYPSTDEKIAEISHEVAVKALAFLGKLEGDELELFRWALGYELLSENTKDVANQLYGRRRVEAIKEENQKKQEQWEKVLAAVKPSWEKSPWMR